MNREKRKSFVELCINGKVIIDEIDDFIDEWHEFAQEMELHEFLGMNWEDYSAWVTEPDQLSFIIAAHHCSKKQ